MTRSAAAPAVPQKGPARPNFCFFFSDDHSRRDTPRYGATDVRTPNLERLAAAGMTFDRAYATSPSCAPSRTCYLSGVMPAKTGVEPNQVKPRPDLKMLPAYFHELGYEVVAFGKVGHYNHTKLFGFDLAEHTGYHEDVAVPAAVEWLKNWKSDRPLAFFVGTNWPHVPWPKDGEGYDPAKVDLSPKAVDTPSTRRWRARYYAAIKRCDADLGIVYDAVRAILGPNTFFGYTTDHGAQWPFGKWNLYEQGIHTPLVISWPGVTKPGSRTDAMVSGVDLLPTLIEMAGGTPPPNLDGRSYASVLRGKTDRHRDRIFATHSGDGNFNVYPIRSVRDARWKYIWNLHPEFVFTSHVDLNPAGEPDTYWASWAEAAKTDPKAAEIVQKYHQRPAEELYDLTADPDEKNNLADRPELADIKRNLRRDLEAWMNTEGDQRRVFGKPHLPTQTADASAAAAVPTPRIAGKALTITCAVTPRAKNGVVLAQGGNQFGYALHLKDGKPVFSVRERRVLYTVAAPDAPPPGKFTLEAHLEADGAMTLAVNGKQVASAKAPGPIPVQPAEELSIGEDTRVAVGDYDAPNPLEGVVEDVRVATK